MKLIKLTWRLIACVVFFSGIVLLTKYQIVDIKGYIGLASVFATIAVLYVVKCYKDDKLSQDSDDYKKSLKRDIVNELMDIERRIEDDRD